MSTVETSTQNDTGQQQTVQNDNYDFGDVLREAAASASREGTESSNAQGAEGVNVPAEKPVEQPSDNGQANTPDPDSILSAKIAELSGGKAKSYEEAVRLAAEEAKSSFHPLTQKLNAYLSGGESDIRTFTKLVSVSGIDAEKLSEKEAILLKMELDNPNRDADWIKTEYEATFGKEPDTKKWEARIAKAREAGDDEAVAEFEAELAEAQSQARLHTHRLGKEAEAARESIRKFQSEIKWEQPQDRQAEAQRIANERRELYGQKVRESAQNLSSFTIPIKTAEGEAPFTYEIGDARREALSKAAEGAERFYENQFSRYLREVDGKTVFDSAALVRDMYILDNLSHIATAIADKAKSGGVKSVIDPMVNATTPEGGSRNTPTQPSADAMRSAAADKLVDLM